MERCLYGRGVVVDVADAISLEREREREEEGHVNWDDDPLSVLDFGMECVLEFFICL